MSETVGVAQFLEVLGGTLSRVEPAGPDIELSDTPLTIGRDEGCGLVLDDKKVSKIHAELVVTPEGVRLRDLGSRNGTFVEERDARFRCEPQVLLQGSCGLRLGNTRFQFSPSHNRVRVETGSAEPFGPLVGETAVMKRLFHLIQKVARTELTALIMGETGTGKELVANAIHLASPRAAGPFIVVDCGSIPEALAESMLFGHEKGSFTGASERRLSPFVEADGGTIFLDEIGELSSELQPRLLRVLQERKIKPVGSNTYRSVNVRIIAATRRELLREINGGSFRSDLYFRLAQAIVPVPSLRERGAQDVELLLKHFAREAGMLDRVPRISADSFVRMMQYDWPGNVRELQNVTARLLGLADPTGPIVLDAPFSSSAMETAQDTQPYDVAKLAFDKTYWKGLIRACNGNITKISGLAGRSRPTVRAELERLGLGKGDAVDED